MWSFYIGKILGINVRVHILFVFFLVAIGLMDTIHYGILAGLFSIVLLLAVFAFVLLHELGHSLVAKHYGIYVKDITLWPLGGIANMQSLPNDPHLEIKLAAAGPLVNLGCLLVLSPIALLTKLGLDWNFFVYLVIVNAILMAFNLIPAFPMDGGRILRAWLSLKMGHLEATRKANQIGTIAAIVLCCLGIVFNIMLLFIGIFILVAGKEEMNMVGQQYEHQGWSVPGGRQESFYFFYLDPSRMHTSFHFENFGEEWKRWQKKWNHFFDRRR